MKQFIEVSNLNLNPTQMLMLTLTTQIANSVANHMIKGNALHMVKCVTIVVGKTTLNQSVDPVTDPTQIGQESLSFLESVANVAIRK